ncbi:hypothetical protein B0H14DRAFT_542427 [Mycena olivaceomarginata]|nr:hypothetical protein B0H14DRAFT_542427 [Mycena olivaceomarginata]
MHANRAYIALISIPSFHPRPIPIPQHRHLPTHIPSLLLSYLLPPAPHPIIPPPPPATWARWRAPALLASACIGFRGAEGDRRRLGGEGIAGGWGLGGDWEDELVVGEVAIVSEVGKGDEREGREEEQMVGRFERLLALQRRRRVEESCLPVERGACLLGFGSEGKGTKIKWDGAEIASFATARLLLDYLLCVASAFSFARPASRF